MGTGGGVGTEIGAGAACTALAPSLVGFLLLPMLLYHVRTRPRGLGRSSRRGCGSRRNTRRPCLRSRRNVVINHGVGEVRRITSHDGGSEKIRASDALPVRGTLVGGGDMEYPGLTASVLLWRPAHWVP